MYRINEAEFKRDFLSLKSQLSRLTITKYIHHKYEVVFHLNEKRKVTSKIKHVEKCSRNEQQKILLKIFPSEVIFFNFEMNKLNNVHDEFEWNV